MQMCVTTAVLVMVSKEMTRCPTTPNHTRYSSNSIHSILQVEYEPIVNCPWGESTQYYLQPWIRARAWAEAPARGTTGAVSRGDWDPVTGINPGMCKPLGQTQTAGTPCTTSAVCVHVLVVNTAPQPANTAVHVKMIDRFGLDTGELSGSMHATLPFGGFESGEMVPVRDGTFSDVIPAFSLRMFRLGCAGPPPIVGNLVPNPSFEDTTITGAVASWGLFSQVRSYPSPCLLDEPKLSSRNLF